MRLRDFIRLLRQRVDFIDLAAWLLLEVAERRGGLDDEDDTGPFNGGIVVRWLREHPEDVRTVLTDVRDELRIRCKHRTLRSRIREALGR